MGIGSMLQTEREDGCQAVLFFFFILVAEGEEKCQDLAIGLDREAVDAEGQISNFWFNLQKF